MLTRGDTTLGDSIAVHNRALSDSANSRLFGVGAPSSWRDVTRGVSELICVELFLWILKPFLAVSRYARMEAKANQDSTERESKDGTA